MSPESIQAPISEVFKPKGWEVAGSQTDQVNVLANVMNLRDWRFSSIPIIRGGGIYRSTDRALTEQDRRSDLDFLSQSARMAIIPVKSPDSKKEALVFFPSERTAKPFSENFYAYRGLLARWLRENRPWRDKIGQDQFPLPQVLDHHRMADGRTVTVTEFRPNLQTLGSGSPRESVEEMDVSEISPQESRRLIRVLNYLNGDAEKFAEWIKAQGKVIDLSDKSWMNPDSRERFLRCKNWWRDRKTELTNWINEAADRYNGNDLDQLKKGLIETIDNNLPIFPNANGENPDGIGCSHVIAHGTVFAGNVHMDRSNGKEAEYTVSSGDRAHFGIPGDDPAPLIASAVKSPEIMSAMIDEFKKIQTETGRNMEIEMKGLGMHVMYRCIGAIKYYAQKPNYEGQEVRRLVTLVKSIIDSRAEGEWWKVIESFKKN